MITSVEVEIVGGRADGQRRVLETDEYGLPPAVFKMREFPAVNWRTREIPEPIERVFIREANPADDGALWLYRLKSP